MSRRFYSNTFTATSLTAGVNSTDTVLAVAAVSGAPSSVPWTGVIDRGNSSEELVTVTNVAGTSLTITRHTDGQSAKSHSLGASFEHVVSAQDLDEPNAHIAATTGAHAASAITNTPAGGIAAVTVQAALNELDAEKLTQTQTDALYLSPTKRIFDLETSYVATLSVGASSSRIVVPQQAQVLRFVAGTDGPGTFTYQVFAVRGGSNLLIGYIGGSAFGVSPVTDASGSTWVPDDYEWLPGDLFYVTVNTCTGGATNMYVQATMQTN